MKNTMKQQALLFEKGQKFFYVSLLFCLLLARIKGMSYFYLLFLLVSLFLITKF